MKEEDVLHTIEKAAKHQKLDVSFFKASQDVPYDSLVVFLGADNQNRPYALNVTVQKQILDPKKESGLFRVEFKVKIPFKIEDFSFSQTSNLVALLNHFLDLPGLEVNEADRELFYRYVLLIDEKGINETLLIGLMGMIKFILDIHTPSLESVASGKMSYDELLEQALNVTI